MITEIISYELEKKGMMANYQSGFWKGSTIDSVIRQENEIRKAQNNKEAVIAVFLDIEKAYGVEGRSIKLHKFGIGGRVFNWIKDFLFERNIQVRIGSELSKQSTVENGTP